MNQRPPYPILCIHPRKFNIAPFKNDGLQGYFPIGFWLLFRTKQWNFGRVFTVYLYFDPYLSCSKILKNLWGGLPIGGGPGDVVSIHSSFGLDPLEIISAIWSQVWHPMRRQKKTHQVWQRRVKNLTPHDEIWLFIMSFPCMYLYVCVHACIYVSVCLSIFLSIHLCISALVHTSIPCKTEIFARQKVMGRVRSFFQASFFTRICQFLGCNGEVWTFFGHPQKKNLQSYPVDFNTSQNLSENPQAEFCQDAHQMPISSCLNAQQPPITFGRPYQ